MCGIQIKLIKQIGRSVPKYTATIEWTSQRADSVRLRLKKVQRCSITAARVIDHDMSRSERRGTLDHSTLSLIR